MRDRLKHESTAHRTPLSRHLYRIRQILLLGDPRSPAKRDTRSWGHTVFSVSSGNRARTEGGEISLGGSECVAGNWTRGTRNGISPRFSLSHGSCPDYPVAAPLFGVYENSRVCRPFRFNPRYARRLAGYDLSRSLSRRAEVTF